jgi:hypothetical protein
MESTPSMIIPPPRPVEPIFPAALRAEIPCFQRLSYRTGIYRRASFSLSLGLVLVTGLCPISSTHAQSSGATVILHDNNGKTPAIQTETQNATLPTGGTPVHGSHSLNELILEIIGTMPAGGGYRANAVAMTALHNSVQLRGAQMAIEPSLASPSFCSGATYLVFLSVLDRLQRAGRLQIDDATLGLLVPDHQPDGVGPWGRWNANGPGTARFFFETGLGRNFTSFDEARPGDFLKVFWNDEIGSREFGHSVVYLGTSQHPDGEYVRYWSSNVPGGFGEREVPRQRIHRVLFSRLEHPEQIRNVAAIPTRDTYLAAMLKRTSSETEAAGMVGIRDLPLARPAAGDPSVQSVSPSIPGKESAAAPPADAATSTATPAPKKGFLQKLIHLGRRAATPSPTPAP